MTRPVSDEKSSPGHQLSHAPPGDEVYITGLSGYFPDSHSVKHLEENLFNKVDLISEDDRRGKPLGGSHSVIPQRTGKIYNIEKFDASFFGVPSKQAHTMDPMGRILLEKAYEAIIDGGFNPNELRNTRTGVFIGSGWSETVNKLFYEENTKFSEFAIPGCSRSMLANRISEWLGVTGPSYSVDGACSSSLLAFEHAYRAIRGGQCDAAIVGGTNLTLSSSITLGFLRLGVLSSDGRCKSFDDRADGYVRSEAIVACFLQKAKDSRRVYAQIVHAKTNCDGFKEQGIMHPSSDMQQQLFSEFYEECAVSPACVEYVEAHGTGTVVGDHEELLALDKVFCADRSEPLLIGSIKSNLGHPEPASGVCSIAKMCIAYNTGYIPPNIHFKSPKQNIATHREGRIKVVTEKQQWKRGMAGVTSLGMGGVNVHVLLKNVANNKVNNGLPSDDLPRLVCASGRTETAVARILDDLESRTVDVEMIRLLHSIHDENIDGHVFRGYILMGSTPTNKVTIYRDIRFFSRHRSRPVLFVYSGLGAHGTGLTQLLRIPIFADAIEKCHTILEPKGINLTEIVTTQDPKIYDNLLNSFVGNTAVQIGLTNILNSVSIEPEFIIGHSVGELGCAYADGCLTAEQTILCAYYTGLVALETKLVTGYMTKCIGLGYNQLQSMCPPEIKICHNGPDSSTISGPADHIKTFVAKLATDGIVVKEVNCCDNDYLSLYSTETASRLIEYLKEVIPFPKKRSASWLSTSSHQSCTAEYFTSSLWKAVPLKQTLRLIPENSVVIDITSSRLLQGIQDTRHKNVINITLTEIDHADNTEILFTALGKLYELGLNPRLASIYPHVSFPVSQGTPFLSHLVEWNHNEDWYVSSFRAQEEITTGERYVKFSVTDEDFEYMSEHVVDGRNLFSATGYLVLVWETLAMMMGQDYTKMSVVFENVRLERATHIPKEESLEFIIMIQKGSGEFEIVESGSTILSGRIYAAKDVIQNFHVLQSNLPEFKGQNIKHLLTKDFYKEMRLRGYQHSGLFRGVIECNVEGTSGRIAWVNNWVTFMDCMLQLHGFSQDSRNVCIPTRIEKISIDVNMHYEAISKMNVESRKMSFEVQVCPNLNVIRATGIEFRGIHAVPITRKKCLDVPLLERNEFVANFFHKGNMTMNDVLRATVQIALENVQTHKVKIVELVDEEYTTFSLDPIIEKIENVLNDIPLVHAVFTVLSKKKIEFTPNITVDNKKITDETNVNLFIGACLLNRPKILHQVLGTLSNNCFVISREKEIINPKEFYDKLDIITMQQTGEEYIVLFRKRVGAKPAKFIKIVTDDQNFAWIKEVQEELKTEQKIVIYNQGEVNGLLGFVKSLRMEQGGEVIHGLYISDSGAPPFDPNFELYEKQLNKDLAINVYQNGEWGTYRYYPLDDQETADAHHAFVNAAVIGDLSSLKWIEGPIRANEVLQNTENNMLIHVYCASLNFRDVMLATGRITSDAPDRLTQEYVLGYEGAGRTVDGTRRMYICNSMGCANMVASSEAHSWEIPEDWTFEEAATVPITYGTALYAMVYIGELKRGESVLIHAGSGGVGQAAINVALHYDCDIFTTVGTPEKRAFLKNLFPYLKDSHIGNSRDTSFEEMVLTETEGKGVDMVLNSLSDEKLLASVRCLKRKGRFVEIGKFDIKNNTSLGMNFFDKEISFYSIALDRIIYSADCRHILKILHDLVQDGITNRTIRPLTYCTFEKDKIEKAFRYMAAGKHTGKVIIKIRDEEPPESGIVKPTHMSVKAVPRYVCKEGLVFVIVGGLGGFGLELADWLILRGARKILLTSRKGISTGYQAYRLRAWAGYNAEIQVSTHDISNESGCEEMLKMANAMGPVEAIFNLAMILKDALFQNQTPETFAATFKPKALATMHLDKVSQKLCPELKHFVVFSSMTSGRGNAGLTNYALSNSAMERICECRKGRGLPALAIQWGGIADVGVLVDMEIADVEFSGVKMQGIASCLISLDKFLKQDATIVSSLVLADKKARGLEYGSIADAVAQIMCIKDLKTIPHTMLLTELGMDSIMAQETKQILEREFEIFLTIQEFRTLSFSRLFEITSEKRATGASVSPTAFTSSNNGVLKVLIRNIGEEKQAWEPFIYLPTMADVSVHDNQKIMFILPGMEGFAAAMAPLCDRLKVKTCVLQFGVGYNTNDTIDTLVNRLYQTMSSQMLSNAPYILLGYSFGSLPMIKLARILESKGHYGQLFCLDGSPNFCYSTITSTLNVSNESQLQNGLISQMIYLATSKSTITADIAKKLNQFETFEEKIQYAIKETLAFEKYTNKFVEAMINSCFSRLKMMVNQNQEGKIKAPITLLRAKDNAFNFTIEDDYGLEKVTEGPVTVYKIEGNHITILENEDCANTINRIIGEQD